MKLIIYLIFFLLFKFLSFGQCPNPSFVFSDSILCVGDTLIISNTSTNINSFNWGLGKNELIGDSVKGQILTIDNAAFAFPSAITLVKNNNNYYGFITNYTNASVVRLDFGSNITNNNPSFEFVPISDTIIPFPNMPLEIFEKNNQWYGYITSASLNSLFLLKFGDSLTGTPMVIDVQEHNLLNFPGASELKINGDTVILIITNYNESEVVIYGFVDSLHMPIDTSIFFFEQPVTNGLDGITITRKCNQWYGFASNHLQDKIYQLEFGSSLFNKPIIKNLGNFGIIDNPLDLKVVYNNQSSVLFVACRDIGLARINLGNDFDTSKYIVDLIGTLNVLPNSRELDFVQTLYESFLFVVNGDNSVSRVDFKNLKEYIVNFSNDSNTVWVSYVKGGNHKIFIDVVDSNNNLNGYSDSVTVYEKAKAQFEFENTCFQNKVIFKQTGVKDSSEINNIIWSFDDGITSNLIEVEHIYLDTGSYNVNLKIEAICGIDSINKNVKVIKKPTAKFYNKSICNPNSVFLFDETLNNSTKHNLWSWQFGDGNISDLQNPSHLYSDTGKFQITYITGVEGCTDTIIDTITFYPKPVANFNSTDICIGDSTNFNDSSSVYLSSLTPINKWNWNFGDINTSSNQFPKHLYADSGKYSVSLIVTTAKNCSDTITKSIDIQKPLAKFLIKEKICDNFPISFIDTSTVNADSIVNWIWGFGAGDSSYIQNPSHTFIDSGNYAIYLKVKSSQNCTHDTVITIYVNLGPTVSFAFDTVCAESPTSFSDNSTIVPSDTIISWTWDFGDSSAVDISQNAQHTYSDGAQYSVTLNVSTQKGCKGIKVNEVIAKPLPVVNFGYSTVCVNNDVNFYDFSSVNNVMNDSIVSWKWFFGDGNSSTSQNPVNLYSTSTTKNVLLIAFTNNNCFDSLVKPVTINPLPDIYYNYTEVCEPETTAFTSSSSLYNLYWTFGEPSSGNKNKSTAINPTHHYKSAGNYFVNLIAVSTDNCTTEVDQTVSVNFIPTANFISDSICQIYPAIFFDSSYVIQSSITGWKWDFYDGSKLDTSQNPSHAYLDTGKYTVNLFVFSEKGCSSVVSQNVQVYQLPDAKFDFTPQFGIPPLNVSFKNKTMDVISYKWYFGDGDTSMDANTSHTYTDTGEYTIKFYVINEYGCMDTLRDLIRVKAPVLDLIVNELLLKLNSNYYESTVNFTNIGNRDIEIINFELEFVNGSTVLEQWSGTLLPSDDDTYIFSSKTKNESISQSDVVCVSAILINDEQDDNPEDNKQCVTLNKEIDLLSPIYDYENKTITIQIISNKEQDILINFYDQLGKVLHKGTVICYEGYNTVEINVARQQAGLYIYTINNDNELIAGKATILN